VQNGSISSIELNASETGRSVGRSFAAARRSTAAASVARAASPINVSVG
jgi:hypothetical protein